MMKVTVTGGAGFVGSVLCELLLNNGYAVRCMDNFASSTQNGIRPLLDNPNFEFMYGNVVDSGHVLQAINDVDAVIHLAATVGFPSCSKDPQYSEIVNVNGTANVTAITNSKKTPLIFFSTGSVYGKLTDTCTETSACNPQSEYGQQKLEAESFVHGGVIFRFATGMGVSPSMRWSLLVNDLVRQGVQNKFINIFQPNAKRTFIHIKDMARAALFALENYDRMKNNVYNVGDDNLNLSKRDIAELVKERTNCYVSYVDTHADPDLRDYTVSYQKLSDLGFKCNLGIDSTINELIKAAELDLVAQK